MPYYALTKSSEVRTYCWAYYARGITENDYVLYCYALTMHVLSPLEGHSKFSTHSKRVVGLTMRTILLPGPLLVSIGTHSKSSMQYHGNSTY